MFDEPSKNSPLDKGLGAIAESGTGTLLGNATASSNPKLPAVPAAVAPPPVFGTNPSKRPGGKKPTQSFIGGSQITAPTTNLGTNTLTGQ